jgi:hypothetical protein
MGTASINAQNAVVYRALKRFERLKVTYSGLYKVNLTRKDTLRQVRQQLADSSSLLHQKRIQLKDQQQYTWQYAQNAEGWKRKAKKRNLLLLTLTTLFAGYVTLHH